MAYNSKNPRTNSNILTDIVAATPDNPAAGSDKIINRNGYLHMRGSAGAETLPIASASASVAGVVDTTAQSFAGVKTFGNGINLGNTNLTYYEEGTVVLSGAITGTLKFTRVGNLVVYASTAILTHASSGTPASNADIPNQFRPSTTMDNCYLYNDTSGDTARISTGGVLTLIYRDETGSVARVNSDSAISGSYIIT